MVKNSASRKFLSFGAVSALLLCISCRPYQKFETHDEFKEFYEQYGVKGSFFVYAENEDKYTGYNKPQFNQSFIPASTFKIINSLIGLETGTIPDENYIIPWDSLHRNAVWDKDHDLKAAYQNSTVWYYQELARRVGCQQMKFWIDKCDYGNRDTSGGVDKFWLQGGLRISPGQQIEFLRKLHNDDLPFSDRSLSIVKRIMIQDEKANYILRAKTGWSRQNDIDIGWYIGYVEKDENVYYFSNCIQAKSKDLEDDERNRKFNTARREIAYKILTTLNII